VQREGQTERFGTTAREPGVNSTTLAGSKLEGYNLEPRRSDKRGRNSYNRIYDIPLYGCVDREESSSSRGSRESERPNSSASTRSNRVGEDLLGTGSGTRSYRDSARARRPPLSPGPDRTIFG
jgi:hypothetical protein